MVVLGVPGSSAEFRSSPAPMIFGTGGMSLASEVPTDILPTRLLRAVEERTSPSDVEGRGSVKLFEFSFACGCSIMLAVELTRCEGIGEVLRRLNSVLEGFLLGVPTGVDDELSMGCLVVLLIPSA
jgi:hypothetical protein